MKYYEDGYVDRLPVWLVCRIAVGLESRPYLYVDMDRITKYDRNHNPVSTLSGWLPSVAYSEIEGPWARILRDTKQYLGLKRELGRIGHGRPDTTRAAEATSREASTIELEMSGIRFGLDQQTSGVPITGNKSYRDHCQGCPWCHPPTREGEHGICHGPDPLPEGFCGEADPPTHADEVTYEERIRATGRTLQITVPAHVRDYAKLQTGDRVMVTLNVQQRAQDQD